MLKTLHVQNAIAHQCTWEFYTQGIRSRATLLKTERHFLVFMSGLLPVRVLICDWALTQLSLPHQCDTARSAPTGSLVISVE